MSIKVKRGERDEVIDQLIGALKDYQRDHPKAKIDLYRQNSVSVRIRIIDSNFKNKPKSQRHDIAWSYLRGLPEDVLADISTLILLTPDETSRSLANLEFEDPVPSQL